jgi:hypothetical protein
MPATSKAQGNAAGMAYAAKKKGTIPPGKGPARQMAESMDLSQLREFAKTPRKGLPKKAKPGKK